MFVGIDGFDEQRGFTGSDVTRCDTANTMMTSANNTIVLTDSSKFLQGGVVSEFDFDTISKVYTDNRIEKEKKDFLEKQAIQVVTV
ncbi:transcription regulator [Tetragenococcus muriaticus PMC-11-5]|uniref:Transcription regulator n=1 Tax=Tetragenococcus muriaticus PMC-11-5 TaxID=1302649 RepID=A0A091BYV9_9ENTE|nr:transcription regulator [Tetragenococcus muriaticus PMC-11-5]